MSARPPRDLRLARLPLLLAYLLVLLGTPIGEAGFLWMHLTTAHSSPVKPDAELERPTGLLLREDGTLAGAPEHEPDTPPAHEQEHEHEHAAHGQAAPHEHEHAVENEHARVDSYADAEHPTHPERIASAGSEPAGRSVALHQAHEHGGRMHTHEQHPAPDAELPIDALSKFYLAPPTTPAPSTSADARHASQILPAPRQVAARIDTPPPRLPG